MNWLLSLLAGASLVLGSSYIHLKKYGWATFSLGTFLLFLVRIISLTIVINL